MRGSNSRSSEEHALSGDVTYAVSIMIYIYIEALTLCSPNAKLAIPGLYMSGCVSRLGKDEWERRGGRGAEEEEEGGFRKKMEAGIEKEKKKELRKRRRKN
ncbi:hypothetical protein PoB_003835600 [Plakobranchus ocellatus]|uniref:Uncharacterized protein n=1 Tax=Plakobranchus ocellatus TaxID=259542 RepID=A0AAV4AZ87_9GAST|nr:hypothetical protein PoB_003835600 [Plakobranchus ocellatus]